MSVPEKSFGKMLIVDDDRMILKLLTHMFEKSYELKTAENGLLALDVLKQGFNPGVILTDQFMPEMTGSQFLAESLKIIPDSSRLILTGNSDPKEIISCINEGKALMYLTKPFEQLELIQAVRIAFHQFNSKTELKKINQDYFNRISTLERQLNAANAKIAETPVDNGGDVRTIIKFIYNVITSSERIYFTPHSKSVLEITQVLANEMQLSTSSKTYLMYAAMIHNLYCISIPEELQILGMDDDTPLEEKNVLLNQFNKSLESLKGFTELKPVIKIINRLWDFVNQETSQRTRNSTTSDSESQILALANQYHNLVYKLTKEQFALLQQMDEVTQTSSETFKRHENAKSLILKATKIFDRDVINAFDELLKNSSVSCLVTRKETLKVSKLLGHSHSDSNSETKPDKSFIKVKVTELEMGMQVGQDISSIRGAILVSKGDVVDIKAINKIKQLVSTGLVDENINVLVLNKKIS